MNTNVRKHKSTEQELEEVQHLIWWMGSGRRREEGRSGGRGRGVHTLCVSAVSVLVCVCVGVVPLLPVFTAFHRELLVRETSLISINYGTPEFIDTS